MPAIIFTLPDGVMPLFLPFTASRQYLLIFAARLFTRAGRRCRFFIFRYGPAQQTEHEMPI